ncbi:MAG: fatty acyl-AMP ligase [Pseudomonadota bacterium]
MTHTQQEDRAMSGRGPGERDPGSDVNSDTNLFAALETAARTEGGMTFYGARGTLLSSLSWADIAAETDLAARRLAALGLAPGSRVFLLAETGPRFVALFAGATRAGLVPCPAPLPFAFGDRAAYTTRLRRLVGDAQAVIAPDMFADWLVEDFQDQKLVFAGGADALPGPASLPAHKIAPNDIAYIQYSSGTTSAPKGIEISHRAMMANVRAIGAALSIGPEDRGVSWLPWYHDMGLVGTLLLPIVCRMSIDCLSTRDFTVRPTLWLDLISRNRGTISYAPSFGYELAARRARATENLDLSSWRVAGIGGDMVRAEALEDFAGAFADRGFDRRAFLPSYGMAEATLGLAFTPTDRGARFAKVDGTHLNLGDRVRRAKGGGGTALALCGCPLPGHDVRVCDADGAVLGEERVGRVQAKGPGLMTGYLDAPEATAEVFDADGWLTTGDLGFLRNGELVIAGREKDVLMLHGRAVWPQDVEWTATAAVKGSGIGDAALFRIPGRGGSIDDGTMILALETRESSPDRRQDLIDTVHAAIRAEHGIEVDVALWPMRSLPRTSSGKLQRAWAQAMHLQAAEEAVVRAAS